MASDLPKHGDAIIEARKDGLGNNKLVASFQFQRFLDQLGNLFDNTSDGDIDQIVASLSLKSAALLGQLDNQEAVVAGLIQENAALNLKNAFLVSKVDNQEQKMLDLEQLLYVDKG